MWQSHIYTIVKRIRLHIFRFSTIWKLRIKMALINEKALGLKYYDNLKAYNKLKSIKQVGNTILFEGLHIHASCSWICRNLYIINRVGLASNKCILCKEVLRHFYFSPVVVVVIVIFAVVFLSFRISKLYVQSYCSPTIPVSHIEPFYYIEHIKRKFDF